MNGTQTYLQAYLIVFASETGRDNWHPLRWDEVPEWVRHPDNMARLVDGEMCMDPTQGDKGSSWYKAERVEVPEAVH